MAGWLVVAVVIVGSQLGIVNSQAYIPFFNKSEKEYSHRYHWRPPQTVVSRPPRQRPPTINLLALGDADGWEVENPQYQPRPPTNAPPQDQRWNPYERSPYNTDGQQPWHHWDTNTDNHGHRNPPRSASLVYEPEQPSIPLRPEYRPRTEQATTTPAPHMPDYQLDYPQSDSDYDEYSELIDYLDLEDLKNQYDVSMEDILKIVEEIEDDYDLALLEKSTENPDYEDQGHYQDEPHNWDDYQPTDAKEASHDTELTTGKGEIWDITHENPKIPTLERSYPQNPAYDSEESKKNLGKTYADIPVQHDTELHKPRNRLQHDNIGFPVRNDYTIPKDTLYRGHVELQTESLKRDSFEFSGDRLNSRNKEILDKEPVKEAPNTVPTTTIGNSDLKLPRTQKSDSHRQQNPHIHGQIPTELTNEEEDVSTEMIQGDEEYSTILSERDSDVFIENKQPLELDTRLKRVHNVVTLAPKPVEKNTLLFLNDEVTTLVAKEEETEAVSTHNVNHKDAAIITETSSILGNANTVRNVAPNLQVTTSSPEPTLSTPELTKLRNRNDYIPPLHKLFSNVETVTRRLQPSPGGKHNDETVTRRPFHGRTTQIPRLEDLFLRATHRSRPLTKDKQAIVWLDTTTEAMPVPTTIKQTKLSDNTIKDEGRPKPPDIPSTNLSSTELPKQTTTTEKPKDFANALNGLDISNLNEAELLKLVNQYTGAEGTNSENKDKPISTKLPKQLEDPFMTLTPKYDKEFQTQMAREMEKVAKASSTNRNEKIPYIHDEIDDTPEEKQTHIVAATSEKKKQESIKANTESNDTKEPDLDDMISEFDEGSLSVEEIYKLVEQYTNPHLTQDNEPPPLPKNTPKPKPTRRTFGNKRRNGPEKLEPNTRNNPKNQEPQERPKNVQRSRLPQTNFSRRKRPQSIAELLSQEKVEKLDISEITKLVNKYTQPNGTNGTSEFNGTEDDGMLRVNGIVFPKSANGRPNEKPNPWLRPPMVGVAILGEGEESVEEKQLDLAERLKPEISIPDNKKYGNVHRHPIPSTIRKASPYGPDFGQGAAVISEYGHHSGRPVITSRLTTTSTTEPTLEAPFDNPELRRPGLYGSGSGFGEDDFLEEEEIDIVYDYEEVEDNTKSAIIASSVLGGLAVLFFIILLLVCRWRQKAWRRLSKDRIPDSNSSLPTVSPKVNRKGGQNSQSGLWTLLRKSKRNIDRSNSLNSSDDPS